MKNNKNDKMIRRIMVNDKWCPGAPGSPGCRCSCRNKGGDEVQGNPEVMFAGLRQCDADENARSMIHITPTNLKMRHI